MLRFDLKKILQEYGKRDIEVIVDHLPDYTGDSYLLNYSRLHRESKQLKCEGVHLINYIVLASFRDFYMYKSTGNNTLHADLCPLTENEIIKNPFIEKYGQEIKFLLEPGPGER